MGSSTMRCPAFISWMMISVSKWKSLEFSRYLSFASARVEYTR